MMNVANSALVNYVKISPNSNARTNSVKKITVHHMAANLSVETCGNVFQSRAASSNYGIGSDGRVGLYVDESRRSWASSSPWNDHQAITIEVANSSTGGEWPVSEAAWNKLVLLCADICKRYGFRLNYTGNSSGSLTEHRMFTATACPGPYLHARMSRLAQEVNAYLDSGQNPSGGGGTVTPQPQPDPNAELDIDGSFGPATVRKMQSQFGTTIDGIISRQPFCNQKYLPNCPTISWQFTNYNDGGSLVIQALQRKVGADVDGWCGQGTVKSLQTWLRTICGYSEVATDGSMGPATVKAVQKALNAGFFNSKPNGSGNSGGSTAPAQPTLNLGDERFWGPAFTRAMQSQLGTTVDGIVSGQPSVNKPYLPNVETSSWQFTSGQAIGSNMIAKLQTKIGTTSDRFCGPNTVKALQQWLNARGANISVDGSMGPATCQAVAKALKQGAFK